MSERMKHQIEPSNHLSLDHVESLLDQGAQLELSEEAKSRITRCREWLDAKMEAHDGPIYGINTGFGSLCDTSIAEDDLKKLQQNLVMSHACGTGDEVPQEIVKLMLFLKAQGLSYGHSGSQLRTVERLLDLYNADIFPVVYQLGSLGASGDLAPLAHMSLPLLGLGDVSSGGKKQSAKAVLNEKGWEPIRLKSKEGLALLNGTQFMSAYGVWCLIKARRLADWADAIGALSLEGFDGRQEPFHPSIHAIRGHAGQALVAANLRQLLEGSELIRQPKIHVQDPYSFRCMPQVHGASRDAIQFVTATFENEINAVTDNPTIFPDEDLIISAGNFHGQPLALALDQLAIALAELGSISERRVYKLISGERDLPAFLVANPGLNSGFMIPQYTAASIVSQNKQLCTPASVDSIESSNGQEDHVSMGANAATKAYRVVQNLERILAIELLNASQALEFRRPLKSSPALEKMVEDFRKAVPFVAEDRTLYPEIDKAVAFIQQHTAPLK